MLRHVQLFAALWIVANQAPLSVGFSKQEYWIGLPFLTPGDLPDPGIEPTALVSATLAGGFFTTVPPGKGMRMHTPTRLLHPRDFPGESMGVGCH